MATKTDDGDGYFPRSNGRERDLQLAAESRVPSERNQRLDDGTDAAALASNAKKVNQAGSKTTEGMAPAVRSAPRSAPPGGNRRIGTSTIVPGLGWVVAGPVYMALAGGGPEQLRAEPSAP